MNYILLYLIVGLPVSVSCGLVYSKADRVWKRVLFGLVMLTVWPLVPVAMIRELLAMKRIQEVCAWCGETVASYKDPGRLAVWREHHKHCPKHPMREEVERLKKKIEILTADYTDKEDALRMANDTAKNMLKSQQYQINTLSSRCSILQIRLDRERKDGDRLADFLDTILKFVKDAGYGQSPEIVDALETYRRGARVIDEQDGLKEEPSE